MKLIFTQIRFRLVVVLILLTPASFAMNQMKELASIGVIASVPPYTSVSVSTSEISFEILGAPGEYTSTEIVTLNVDSNQSEWNVYAKSSNLIHKDFGVPPLLAERLSFSVDGKNFKPLIDKVLFLTGSNVQASKPVNLQFKLKTTWEDAPGVYKGKVTIALFNNP